jgi:hypothetical protein
MITKKVIGLITATVLAIGAVVCDGADNRLLADDEWAPCVVGGAGPLCYTKTVQECVSWRIGSTIGFGMGSTFSLGLTPTCERWETTTTYYNRDTQGSGGGGSGPAKPDAY